MSERRKVVLIGWDAADWQTIHPLMDSGRMPNLRRLVEGGTSGDLRTLMPALSPMLWTTIASGRLAEDHGILGFFEPDPNSGKIRPSSSTSRRVKAIWNILEQHGLHACVVNWMASHPAEAGRGTIVSNALSTIASSVGQPPERLPAGVVYPATAMETILDLMVVPTDLSGRELAMFIPALAGIDHEKDKRPRQLAQLLSQAFTTHAVTTWILEQTPWDFVGAYYDFIDRGGHLFMQFAPPQLEGVSDEDFALYQHVMQGIYECHDLMLGRILQLAGPDATILLLSDHGFLSGERRPSLNAGPEGWHREHGVFVAYGPGIKKDELVFGANLLDIMPTLLALFGLPVGVDMPGRVLVEMFEDPPTLQTIPTWEDGADTETRKAAAEALGEAWDAAAMIDQLAALGYVDDRTDDEKQRADRTRLDQTFNLARSLMGAGKPEGAIPLLEEIVKEAPENHDARLTLALALIRSKRFEEARTVASAMVTDEQDRPLAHLLLAEVESAQGNGEAALASLEAVEQSSSLEPNALDGRVGRALLLLGRAKEAEGRFRRALARTPKSGALQRGLSIALWRQKRIEESAEAALEAVGCEYASAEGHFLLGRSLASLGRADRALQALEICLRFQPGHVRAQRWRDAIVKQQAE